ncbi:MAG TPA: hypothetical protein VIU46_05885 [Gallionellaceae bacterium]
MAHSVNINGTLSIGRFDHDAVRQLSAGNYDLVQLVNNGLEWADLEFLSAYTHKIHRLRLGWGVYNSLAGLEKLTELTYLDLDDLPPDPVYDFSSFSNLQVCKMRWSPKLDQQSFFSLPNLNQVALMWCKTKDCTQIGFAHKLRTLELRFGVVSSLDGLSNCKSLEELRIIRVKGLTSLDEIAKLTHLKTLEIDKGSKFSEVARSLSQCSNLAEVLLEGDFEITDLEWIRKNARLTRFRSDATVQNVDWHAVFNAPALSEIAFAYTPGGLMNDGDIKTIAESCGKPVRWIEHGGTRRRPWVEIHFN